MSNKKQDYKKQRLDLIDKINKHIVNEFNLIDMIIEARKQRDYYKINLKKSKSKNASFKKESLKQQKKLDKMAKDLKESFQKAFKDEDTTE